MQPPESIYDFNFRDITNNPEKASFVGISKTGRKYVFPAEYDIFIDVSPHKYDDGSDELPVASGNVIFKVTHLTSNPTPPDSLDNSWTTV